MSENENLPQDDINMSFVNPGKQLEYLSEDETNALGEIANISVGASTTTLAMLINQKVSITAPKVNEYDDVTDLFNLENDFITIEITYKEGLDGLSVFAMHSRDAKVIADLMMGGEGEIDESPLTELQLSAVSEAMNQMIGTSATNLSTLFNFPITIGSPETKLQKAGGNLDLNKEIFNIPVAAITFKFIVEGLIDSEMIHVIPLSSAKEMVETLLNSITNIADEIESEQQSADPQPDLQPNPQGESYSRSQYMDQEEINIPRPETTYSAPPPLTSPQGATSQPVTVQPVQFASFNDSTHIVGESNKNLDLLMDIKLRLTVELGRTELPIGKVLELTRGSVIELDKVAGEPVELFANGKLIARGEVVVIEDNFGLRITGITNADTRLANLK